MTCRLLRYAVLSAAAVALTAADAAAFIPPLPETYTIVTGDGAFVFVMLAPQSGYWGKTDNPESAAVRAKYLRSGMYRNDGSAVPLWTSDGYVYRFQLDVFPDGVHLVTRTFLPQQPDDAALTFYAHGQILRSYTVRELVTNPDSVFEQRYGPRNYAWCQRTSFRTTPMEFTVETVEGRRYVFDVRAGRVVAVYHPARVNTVTELVVGVGTVGVLAAVWVWRRTAGWRAGRPRPPIAPPVSPRPRWIELGIPPDG